LVIDCDESDGRPDAWRWAELLDTPHTVAVVACTRVADDPDDGQVEVLNTAADVFVSALRLSGVAQD
jgi:hypothetical protein